jgi:hypothetical protein
VRHGARQLTSMFPATSYDSETLDMLIRVFDKAWAATRAKLVNRPFDANVLRSALAKAVIAAAACATEVDRVAGGLTFGGGPASVSGSRARRYFGQLKEARGARPKGPAGMRTPWR